MPINYNQQKLAGIKANYPIIPKNSPYLQNYYPAYNKQVLQQPNKNYYN